MSDEIETPLSSVLAALQQLHVPDDEFRRLDDATAKQVVAAAREKFVVGRPRIWWLDLKLPKRVFTTSSSRSICSSTFRRRTHVFGSFPTAKHLSARCSTSTRNG
ncbi:MAG TPA: hypothetical protein VIA18_28645 [Polyangia bacterium]|nr:hypothetical protein [Polyangia bacterium]